MSGNRVDIVLEELPAWLQREFRRDHHCRDCSKPIIMLQAHLEDGSRRTQLCDAQPRTDGWVRVTFKPKRIWVRRFNPGEFDIAFRRHFCELPV